MDAATVKRSFVSYLEKCWLCSDVKRFLLVYIQLLLLFRTDLSPKALSVILERQKQLHGQPFDDSAFEDMKRFVRDELNRHLNSSSNDSTTEVMLNKLLFCAMLDGDETDFFYLTEPLFEFSGNMGVDSIKLKKILESEFVGFRIEV
jgi:hypothetical protein